MVRSVRELSPDQKAVIENLLGRQILENEEISIRAIQPPAISREEREPLARELADYFARVDAKRQSGSPEDADKIVNEAMRTTRPNYRPHR